ncbi:glycosyltransferase family 2 protein [Serpula lacrymans var. lacrymans S7.3]|uniref:chitin synthase n=2 Tax=Serpula lacrymans var. lacrymans TaxID=341189 RepID=F8Q8Q7_SERL3|nr:glycosyltransferase family 2 protein [Serpula lacrymans var. lacrymans S7.9]EGN94962.1 glycosyltransferase family 2 protein [Serpula lacrymans var. lacrymans S7.3]EGO20453.1 glycosyltransferase family 2 protein [Serpula lacrymans var. lacrymans S7.9]
MASASASLSTHAVSSGDLVHLVSSSSSAIVYPSDDVILTVLNTRFRADLPYTRIGTTNLLVVNPYKTLANVNDINAKEYEERCYKDTSLPLVDASKSLQPHVYELAAKMYLLMRRRNESQSVLTRGITGSGKSSSSRLILNQLLRLSAHSKKELRVADQVKALGPLLDAFGNVKTLMNPNASRHSRYLELHFNDRGRIESAKVLAFGLDKSRLVRLSHEERSYHVFYQFLAGATPEERDIFNLEDPSDYALLASSGCYRLPSGPFSDDAISMEELRAAMKTLGFKSKHMTSIFTLLVVILLLGNLQFTEADARDVSAYVANTQVLDQIARLLGVSSEDLTQTLTNKTNYVRKELYTVLLNAEQSAAQRDSFVRDLYAILFAFVVETANHKIVSANKDVLPSTQILMFDQPGFQTRGPTGTGSMAFTGSAPLVSAYGQNAFDEFAINFADEMVHSYVLRNTFEDSVGYNGHITGDGAPLPAVTIMDNSACVELLRGAQLSEKATRKPGGLIGLTSKACSAFKSGKAGENKDEDLLQDLVAKLGVHTSFVASPSIGGANERNLFGINHYAGNCSYDITDFIEKDSDLLDCAFVTLLRNSTDSFVSKLVSGPSLAVERHSKDEAIIVQAQVSSRPLRQPTPIPARSPVINKEEHARLDPTKIYTVTTQMNHTLSEIFSSLDRTRLWTISCIRPNDSSSPNSFDKRRVKAQVRSLLIPDLVAKRSVEYVADLELSEFCDRYVPTMRGSEQERIRQCAAANGWRDGVDFVVGHRMIWVSYSAWKMVEDGLRVVEKEQRRALRDGGDDEESMADDGTEYTHTEGGGGGNGSFYNESHDNLLVARRGSNGSQYREANQSAAYGLNGPSTPAAGAPAYSDADDGWGSEWDKKGEAGDRTPPFLSKEGGMIVNPAPAAVEEMPTSRARRMWLYLVWGFTGLIPSFVLHHVGRMKRPDIRLAWREKVTIFMLIFLMNVLVIFYIVEFGRLLCPNFDKVWSTNEVAQHTGNSDYWVAIQGQVYDVSNFIHGDHSDISGIASNSVDTLDQLAGQELTDYFPPPLILACPGLVSQPTLQLTYKNFTPTVQTAMHNSGATQSAQNTLLDQSDWYTSVFLPKIKQYRKGPLVWDTNVIASQAQDQNIQRLWAIWEGSIYDLTDYVNTVTINQGATNLYQFLDNNVASVFKQQAGQDVTSSLNQVLAGMDPNTAAQNVNCLKNMFYLGETDFRKTARCQVQNYLLLVFTSILCASIALKFLSALQLTGKRSPEMLDKFVLCQVPCYTESEDSLRRTIDSLAALNYDDKRKLMFIICDGNIIGSGNDRTTPRIVLDILGVDPKLDPEPLLFKSIGEGSKQLNYGKVYSGLYEFEGHVVPYMVVVKVGKPTERSKPGNRGKRDSQILLMHYLNRVHFDAPMSPLELEIYHQMRNVIGIDPAFYEYIFTIDADTSVTPDSLNRLVACAADDSSIIGICGETKLMNEEGSWWTMIQVYEYYISHHLSKAFESLFGSVSCLPGCFSLYRIRTADKGRPIIISNRIIDEYAEGNVDTLHKKNLFSLGEDRFLTTLLLKHFPTFKTKFSPDAVAHTMAPESWRVLFSQRRRWINSTVHNLCELILLPELCGFCCFSMRFFVFIDLLGTIILPATVVYLVYLVVVVATGNAALPIISIIMLGITYGLQALIFIIKREFMLVGWMVVYLISYPVYSLFLPVYSFWCMDDFTWGNTRVVIGEGGNKKVVMNEDERFDESMIPLKKFSEYEAEAWETGSHRSQETGYSKPQSRFLPSRKGSPHSFHPSEGGDYYRDTNLTLSNTSNPNIRLPHMANSQHSHGSRHGGSQYGGQPPVSQYGLPQIPFMPFSGGPGSAAGSDYGGQVPIHMPPMGYQHTGSMYGMMPVDPRTTVMTNMNMFTGSGSQTGGYGALPAIGDARPISTFSMATSVNPFAGPSMITDPTDDDLFNALRNYLSTQDLMTVTKKTAREAIMARFPKADLTLRKDFLNQSIDKILSQS